MGVIAEYGVNMQLVSLALMRTDLERPAVAGTAFSARRSDHRYLWFTSRYGVGCWEPDALGLVAVRERVGRAIRDLNNCGAWNHDAEPPSGRTASGRRFNGVGIDLWAVSQ